MVVGEKPGKEEELLAQCFVHTAGIHFKSLLSQAGIEQAYYTLAVKCPGKPKKEHKQTCKWWLWQEIQWVQPKVILTLGHLPSTLLLKTNQKLESLAGNVFDVEWTDAKIACCRSTHSLLNQGKKADQCTIEFLSSLRGFMNPQRVESASD